jgi:uncharacterized protein
VSPRRAPVQPTPTLPGYTLQVPGLNTVFASLPQLLATALVVAAATAIYVLLGFGSGLIALGTLALILPDLRDVVVLLLLVSLPPEVWVVASTRRAVQWRGALLVLAGIAVGVPLGTALLDRVDPGLLLVALGAFLVLAGLALLADPVRAVTFPSWTAPPVGLVSGVLSGLFGTGGPPLILYYRLAGVDKGTFRANLMAVFLVVTLVRLPSYAVAGLLTVPRLLSALLLLPAVIVGVVVGHRVHLRLGEQGFRRLVSIALVLLGLALLLRYSRAG